MDGHADCGDDVSKCEDSSTEPYVTKLSKDNDKFVEQFIDVFTVMIENVRKRVYSRYCRKSMQF